MKAPLDKLVREARDHLGAPETRKVDWDAVDGALFARIEEERREERSRFVVVGRRWPTVVAATLVAAAAFAFAVRSDRDHARESLVRSTEDIGGRIVAIDIIEHAGQVLIDGRPAAIGAMLRLGDVLEVRGAQATIERTGKLTMRVEEGTRAAVKRTDGSLVLALAEGAVEAQVVPVPSGEAFAVDIGGARVAVHGTHLRVARSGDRVAVDLNEGVVAVGNAPRVGSVVGALVTAPAHADFAAADASGTLTVTHDRAAVRSPVALGPAAPAVGETPAASPAEAPLAPAASPLPPGAPVAAHAAGPAAVLRPDPRATAAAAQPTSAQEPGPEEGIVRAVRACMSERPSAENVTVVVSTTLHLDLADDGAVRAARFDPPVAPDVNTCAAPAIYRARFPHGGTASIGVDFSN